MPILKYRCRECGKEFAKIWLEPANAPRECPVCDAADLEEIGPAFDDPGSSFGRLLCSSCGACDETSPCPIPQPT